MLEQDEKKVNWAVKMRCIECNKICTANRPGVCSTCRKRNCVDCQKQFTRYQDMNETRCTRCKGKHEAKKNKW